MDYFGPSMRAEAMELFPSYSLHFSNSLDTFLSLQKGTK